MSNQIAAPIPIALRRETRIITTDEVVAGVQQSTAVSSTPVRGIKEDDYSVPAPPPPSPINFPRESWTPMKRH
ncbi:hypothetical protein MKZ38_001816 [Zalerion maritima]|uniref:Uncharacterized protein n=1 Tax=Zalerion maritima TaxID=339359 RepID=A0AAD5WTK7_9PEZI|nr:hypothetical protein MKZ38_001816 [Zalerion maritima]